MKLTAACLLGLLASASGKVYFEEKFGDDWDSNWVKSSFKQNEGTAGEFTLTAGKHHGDADSSRGVQTGPDARFYAMTAAMDEVFDNKDKDLVLQYSVKHEQNIDCGGGYIKLAPSSTEVEGFGGDSPYSIMFGPDICGSTKRIHVIFNYKGDNHLIKKTIPCETDTLSHVYTLVVSPDNSYKVMIDGDIKSEGSMEEDWSMLAAKQIIDPDDKKPEDWDERSQIPDPEDAKPEGYDDIEAQIADPEASKPDDWDDEDDGEWEPRMIDNPDFEGEWKPKMIENPDFKGIWKAQTIDNPDYVYDSELYRFEDNKYVGFELWQVKSGTIFDNILVTDDQEYAKTFAEETTGKNREGEKAMFDAEEAEKAAEREAEQAAAEAAKEDLVEGHEEDDYEEDYADILADAEAAEESHDEL